MNTPLRLFGRGWTISFLGSLPLGTLNLSVANYAFRHDPSGALGFSLAAIFVEMFLVRIAIVAIRRLERLTHFFRVFNWLTCALLLFLAANSLLAAWQMQTFRATLPLSFLNPVLAGFLLSLTNPLHLPFWLGWIGFLRSKNLLSDNPRSYNIFILAIGAGTAAAFSVYSFAGAYLIRLLGTHQPLLNWAIGIALLLTAGAQLYKSILRSPREASFFSENTK